MRYYFSGVDTLNEQQRERLAPMCPCRLLSVHGPFMKTAHEWLEYLPRRAPACFTSGEGAVNLNEVMLDSGAFSAWSQGKPTTLDAVTRAYDQLLQQYGDRVKQWWLINLDVIPGTKGYPASPEQMQQAMVDSDANYAKLRERFGDIVLPVYHQFEPASRLQAVAAQNPGYICVSPQNDVPEPLRLKFAQSAHEALKVYSPNTHTHGLAATGMRMMTLVPWYSADSISWQYSAGIGKIFFWDGSMLHGITMSERDSAAVASKPMELGDEQAQLGRDHWRSIHPSTRAAVEAQAVERGYTVEQLQKEHSYRAAFNMETVIEMITQLDRTTVDQSDMFSHGEAGVAAVEAL